MDGETLEKAKMLESDLEHLESVIGLIKYFNMEYSEGKYHKVRTLNKIKAFFSSSISFNKDKIGVHQYNDKHWYNTQIDIQEVSNPRVKAEYADARNDILNFMAKRLEKVKNNCETYLNQL